MLRGRGTRAIRGEGRTGCVLWLLFLGLVIYALVEIVPARINAGQFQDAIQEQATFGATHQNPQIYSELLEKAVELKLPIRKDQITINRTRESIQIEAHYVVPVEFFGGLIKFSMAFDPVIARPLVQM
ncbi:MAG TPA: hypothetical protein VJA66_11660 [Thermoanaerobaculia bacterium]